MGHDGGWPIGAIITAVVMVILAAAAGIYGYGGVDRRVQQNKEQNAHQYQLIGENEEDIRQEATLRRKDFRSVSSSLYKLKTQMAVIENKLDVALKGRQRKKLFVADGGVPKLLQ